MCSETLQAFVKEATRYPTIPLALIPCGVGAAYLARQGVRLCLSAALTMDKVKAAACILGAIYIISGIIIVTRALLIHPDKYEGLRKDLDENSHGLRFVLTPINVITLPVYCFLGKGIFE